MKTKQFILSYVAPSLVAAAMILATTPASARDQVPFRGVVAGSVISVRPLDACNQLIEVVNGGNASHLGRFTGTAEFVVNVCDLTYVGSRGDVFTAANGDSIAGPFTGTLTPTDVQGVFDNTETAFISSGRDALQARLAPSTSADKSTSIQERFLSPGKGLSRPSAQAVERDLDRSSECAQSWHMRRRFMFPGLTSNGPARVRHNLETQLLTRVAVGQSAGPS